VTSASLGSINHLRLSVSDIPRAQRFYEPVLRLLGMRLVERSATRLAWAGFAAHGLLHWFILSQARPGHRGAPHDRYAPGFHHLAFNADSRAQVDELYALLRREDAVILDPPREYDYEPGYYAVFFADPDGFKLELVHRAREHSEAYWRAFEERGGPLET
jgi:catechol 2,3-dioxygenase-like lactoylglutathione lyase family enzyme